MESIVDYITENIVNRFVNNVTKNIYKKINKIILRNMFLLLSIVIANFILYHIFKFYITYFSEFYNNVISLFILFLLNIIFYLMLKKE